MLNEVMLLNDAYAMVSRIINNKQIIHTPVFRSYLFPIKNYLENGGFVQEIFFLVGFVHGGFVLHPSLSICASNIQVP